MGTRGPGASVERVICWCLPGTVLLVAYAGVCWLAGTSWPWSRVVHEDGIRTLSDTVLYFEHATRELVPDLVLALAVAGAMRGFFPPRAAARGEPGLERRRWQLGAIAATALALILGGTLVQNGARAIADNLSQLHTREGAALVWGAHWRYHLIERFAELCLAYAAAGALWLWRGRPDAGAPRGRWRAYTSAVVLFGALTASFHLTSESFRDPTVLGHQLRELFTHALVTFPLAMGVCAELSRGATRADLPSTAPVWPIAAATVAAVSSGAFLLIASVRTGSQSHGQVTGLAALLFPHFFEHSLGYIFVPALAGVVYLWPVSTPSRRV